MAAKQWNAQGVIHYPFLRPSETVAGISNFREIDVKHKKLKKRQQSSKWRGATLLLDYGPPYKASIAVDELTSSEYEILPHPPYSRDISQTYYHLYLDYEAFLRSQKYHSRDEVMNAPELFLAEKIKKDFFQKGLYDLPEMISKKS